MDINNIKNKLQSKVQPDRLHKIIGFYDVTRIMVTKSPYEPTNPIGQNETRLLGKYEVNQ